MTEVKLQKPCISLQCLLLTNVTYPAEFVQATTGSSLYLWSFSCMRILGIQWYWDSSGVRRVSLVDGVLKGFYMPWLKFKLQISLLFSLKLIASPTPSGFLTLLHWPYQGKLNNLETVPYRHKIHREALSLQGVWIQRAIFLPSRFLSQTLPIKSSLVNSELMFWKVNVGKSPTLKK